MRMYAACLASYNNGRLHGEWFDLEDYSDKDELIEAIAEKVLRTSPFPNVTVECPCCSASHPEVFFCMACKKTGKVPSAEEWAAHDWDGEGLSEFGEYPDLDDVLEHVRLVDEHGAGWVAFRSYFGDSVTEENFQNAHRGEYDTFADFVEEWCCEMYDWKGDETFYPWIDWERAGRDLQGDFTYTDGHVFYSNW